LFSFTELLPQIVNQIQLFLEIMAFNRIFLAGLVLISASVFLSVSGKLNLYDMTHLPYICQLIINDTRNWQVDLNPNVLAKWTYPTWIQDAQRKRSTNPSVLGVTISVRRMMTARTFHQGQNPESSVFVVKLFEAAVTSVGTLSMGLKLSVGQTLCHCYHLTSILNRKDQNSRRYLPDLWIIAGLFKDKWIYCTTLNFKE